MNLLSEHNRILRVGEGGSQEYFAGPNINITDHVISGKYWDNEINSAISSTSGDIVNEAFNQSTAWTEEQGYLTAHQDVSNLPYVQNSALGYNGNLISSISGDGFFAESANNSYHADDADHATYADSATHADSADFVATANFANSASSALNAEVANVAYTALTAQFLDGGWEHDNSGNITAYNNSAFVGVNGGQYEGIEPIIVNNEEMKISAKSALLGVQQPLYFVEDSETATVIGIDSGVFPTFEGTPDGKISAINGSALNADPVIDYSAGNNIDITDHIISVTGSVVSADRADYAVSATSSHFSHSAIEAASAGSATYDNLGREITATYLTAVTGDNTPYSAGANIDITNHVISGKDWSSEISDASANALNEAINNITAVEFANSASALTTSAGWDVAEYTAGDNINITNHVVSGKNWSDEITAASSYAYEQATGNIPDVTNLAYVQNSALYVDGDNNLTAISSYNVGHPQVPVTGSGSVTISKPGDTVIIHGKEYDSDISAASSYAYEQATAHIPNGVMFASALDYDQNNTITGYDGSAIGAQVVDYSAGANIDITNHVVSGKNWTNDITGASSYAYGQATALIPSTANLPYVQNSALKIDNNKVTGISGYEIGSTGSLYPQVPVVGVDGVSITKQNDTVLIGLSANVGNYVGIDPIVVDNDEGAISANTARFGVQAPLYFVSDTPNATIIGIEGTDAGALSASSYSTAHIPGAWNLSSYNNVSVTYTGAFVSGAEYRKISNQSVTGPYSGYTQLTSGGLIVTGNNNGTGSASLNHNSIKVATTNSYTEIAPAFIAASDRDAVIFVTLNASDLKCIKEAAAWVSAHSGSL